MLFKSIIKKALKYKVINSCIDKTAIVANLAYILNSKIGAHSSIGRYTNVLNAEIGKFCSISYFCTVGATKHYVNRISTNAFPYIKALGFVDFDERIEEKVYVGNDVWIGANAIIKPKIKIGDGAVIGAGAVVTKDVPPYAIVVGSPARIIKYRFDEKTIKTLEKVQWWNLDKKILKNNIGLFRQDMTPEVLDKLLKLKGTGDEKDL